MSESEPPFFLTRGVILLPEDIMTGNWLQMAQAARLTTIGTHITPSQVIAFIRTPEGRDFLDQCRTLGIEVEHELHAIGELLPRELFAEDPAMFRMNEQGERIPDVNLCVHSQAALEVICRRALEVAEVLRPTTGRYFFWADDGRPMCRCPQCRGLSDSEQTLMLENALIKALRQADPRAKLAHLAYQNTLDPPLQVRPEPGIFLEYAPIRRRYDVPLRCVEKDGDDPTTSHAAMQAALEGNLEVFGSEDAQVLEYWLDVSRFASWKRESTIAIPWRQDVFETDLETYASYGIRHITSFACWADGDYIARFGEPPVRAYGEALATSCKRGAHT